MKPPLLIPLLLLLFAAQHGCEAFVGASLRSHGTQIQRLRACEADYCPLPGGMRPPVAREQENWQFDSALALLPVAIPCLAFTGYDEVLSFTTWAIDNGPGNWAAVDGGKEQVELLKPTINGVILPAISIALGTLSATTIGSLRSRQISLRGALHKEACLLDMLFSAALTVFDGRRREDERQPALMLLQAYSSRLISESTASIDFDDIAKSGAVDSEMRTFIRLLHRSPPIRDSVDKRGVPLAFHEGGLAGFTREASTEFHAPPASSEASHADLSLVEYAIEPRTFDATAFNAQINAKELMMVRSERLALLQTSFPPIHWACMVLLGGSIVLCFLLETDEKALQAIGF